jgi:hypothetical protein
MANPTDVVIDWMCSIPKEMRAKFQRPTKFIDIPLPHDETEEDKYGQHYSEQFQWQPSKAHPWVIGGWPHPLAAIFKHWGVTDPLRVLVLGFSQGCQGVGTIMKSQDAGYVEHAIAFDGIHCGWYPGTGPNPGRSNIEPTCLGTWIATARNAASGPIAIGGLPPGQRYCTITHSSIIPPTYPATFDTAREIMAALWEEPPTPVLPPGLVGQTYDPPWIAKGVKYTKDTFRYAAGEKGLTILGYDNIDLNGGGAADHIYQGNVVFKHVMETLVIPRWNEIDPTAPTCTSGSTQAGPGKCNPTGPVIVPPDYFLNPQDASIDWKKYLPPMPPPSETGGVGTFLLSMLFGGVVAWGGKTAIEAIRENRRR